MFKANIYLNFNGNTEEAFDFYKSVFGGDYTALRRFRDIPDGPPLPSEVSDKIMHIALPLGENMMLMATDALELMGQQLTVGNNFYISLYPESEEEGHRLFAALSEGGKIEAEFLAMFWGAMFGSFADKFGVQWMFSFEPPKA
ncbi:MAG: VOC family protein [Candidatus Sericytochromatia bacterium]|nr:VOC family protein [Candidatus Sericytochromatia bacterium]